MILYKAIKYYILDYCLERIFNGIGRNFKNGINTIMPTEITPGMFIKRLEMEEGQWWWTDVHIISIERMTRRDYEEYDIVFACKDTNTLAYDGFITDNYPLVVYF